MCLSMVGWLAACRRHSTHRLIILPYCHVNDSNFRLDLVLLLLLLLDRARANDDHNVATAIKRASMQAHTVNKDGSGINHKRNPPGWMDGCFSSLSIYMDPYEKFHCCSFSSFKALFLAPKCCFSFLFLSELSRSLPVQTLFQG